VPEEVISKGHEDHEVKKQFKNVMQA